MTAIYNEIDKFAVRWLRNLIAADRVTTGVVDDRSISDLSPADVAGHGQRHFFAGIAGWSLALRLAGVPDDADVWTGSCPCQGFSSAGRQRGFDDPRHLWPTWFRLIDKCRPPVIFGEQVASRLGLAWLDLVFADLEGAGYACAAADLPAAGVGAPHKRQRLFFVAYATGIGRSKGHDDTKARAHGGRRSSRRGRDVRMAHADDARLEIIGEQQARQELSPAERGREAVGLGDADGESGWRNSRGVSRAETQNWGGMRSSADRSRAAGYVDWSDCDWISCSDGTSRPVEPGTRPLVAGLPGRVGLLRGYGNAFVPEVGAAFITAALEAA